MLSKDTDLHLSGELAGDCLGIGATWDSFHSIGTQPFLSDWLKREVMDGAMLLAVIFNNSAEISSGPVALLESREANCLSTRSTSHSKSSGNRSVQAIN